MAPRVKKARPTETLAFSRLPSDLRRLAFRYITLNPHPGWVRRYLSDKPAHPMTKVTIAHTGKPFSGTWGNCDSDRRTRWRSSHVWVSICLRPTTHVLP